MWGQLRGIRHHNRKINKTAIHFAISGEMLWNFMEKQKSKGTIQVKVPKKDRKPERLAICNIKFSKVNVLPSKHYGSTGKRV